MQRAISYSYLESPLGRLLLVAEGPMVTGLYMPGHRGLPEPKPEWQRDDALLGGAREQLEAYFAGQRQQFDLPLRMAGTPFQQQVWRELVNIPFGTTLSYGELAQRIGRPGSSRAVGAANGRNPISIIVPCHRVIGADGSLTGYGGGLENKRWLLEFERRVVDNEEVSNDAQLPDVAVSRSPSIAARSGRS